MQKLRPLACSGSVGWMVEPCIKGKPKKLTHLTARHIEPMMDRRDGLKLTSSLPKNVIAFLDRLIQRHSTPTAHAAHERMHTCEYAVQNNRQSEIIGSGGHRALCAL